MRTQIVGGGGREHALAMAMYEPGEHELFFTDPNAGMLALGEALPQVPIDNYQIVEAARARKIGLVVIGPDKPIAQGLGDQLREANIPTVGPSRSGAWLESSKVAAAKFNDRYGIPQPKWERPLSQAAAREYVEYHKPDGYVIKANGLADGKGVELPDSLEEARQTVRNMKNRYGAAAREIIFQERLTGPEVSMFALLDGTKAKVLMLAQDHKRLLDGDGGPNTGGMGAYAPVPPTIVSEQQKAKMLDSLSRLVDGLIDNGIDYRGFVYTGFMLADQYGGDPQVIEYNARLGDPEAQVVLPLLQPAHDLHELFYTAATGDMEGGKGDISVIDYVGRSALTVCVRDQGYPGQVANLGVPIHGLDEDYGPNVIVYHGATRLRNGQVVTSGGRVLYVTGLGETVSAAATVAYAAIGERAIHFSGSQYRRDIGWQARGLAA
ncbi:MAG: purD [Candidatus Saccharibacteria bacterium]|nr:purD [Candidatus Saccharibacteria bacterium]